METARLLSNPFTGDAGDKCFGCSKTNSHGLHLEFAEDGDSVFCRWKPDADYYVMDEQRSKAMGFTSCEAKGMEG